MELIVPLLLLLILSVVTSVVAARLTKAWAHGVGLAIIIGFLMPGAYVAYLLKISNLRDNYHRQRSETYESDGNCVVILGHGYRLEFYDEFPENAQLTVERPGAPSSLSYGHAGIQLVEKNVERVALASSGAFGASTLNGVWNSPVDHYFWVDFATGSVEHLKTEAESRSKSSGVGSLVGADELFSIQEKRERSSWVTWAIFTAPIILVVLVWFPLNRKLRTQRNNHPSFMPNV